ncbi:MULTISPECIES: hypothetical protein [Streptomyces]|uniref:hypothetical protein n=1 Tax=Streptomyces TaxID=1883 RepID=UPI00167E1B41|nr:hypothetical protein [Streptomyces melanogenes]GGP72021.1 hypothetical protein GCM10010278_57570 [Streptomyces melanogenes]
MTITARDIYLELRTLSIEVQRIGQTMDGNANRLDDHETRIRGVERWKYAISASVVTSTASALVALVQIARS